MTRRTPLSWAGLAVAMLVLVGACADGGGGSTTGGPVESTTTTGPGTEPTTTTSGGVQVPTVPAEYAAAVFDAWTAGDDDALATLTSDAAYEVLSGHEPADADQWNEAVCEGAAGSTYCSWNATTETLILRVGNEDASQGRDDAVFEARFEPSG